ncbi:hypothetical protein HY857_02710 [Candidatus Saccharibacteria bacterium]|nr:hypothetical protein [Candidatus Saccharibacteria bacterium]
MKKSLSNGFRIYLVKTQFIGIALVLAAMSLVSLLATRDAGAAQITTRSLTISSGVPSASAQTYTYGFTTATSAAIQSIEFEACTTAIGTCTGPTGQTINAGTEASRSGWTNATTFTRNATGGGGCTPAANVLCLDRTQAASETAGARTLGWNTQTNPSTANVAFFIRITTYSDTGWTTSVDTGTVASAVVQTLTVNAAVAEILNFCVGSTTINDATTSIATDCTGVSGTSVNIGTLDPTSINVSPININGGDNKNGVAMVRTNASNGSVIYYDAIQQSGTNHQGTLRISGASCNAGNVSTDQCIDAQGGTQGTFTAGTEKFGMTVAGTNCGSTTSYTCAYASGTNNLDPSTNYIGAAANTFGTTNGYAWVEGGTATQIADTPGATKVIDDEALVLKFAATPSITTPFGSYAAQADFIAVPTY